MGKQISLKKPAITVILAILIPSLILAISQANSTIESRSYGPATVVYKEPGLLGSPTIEIKINGINSGEPIRVDAFYPTLGGVERLDLDKKRGPVFRASPKNVGPGMGALLQDAGWSERAGLGLLLFITTYEGNETHVTGKTMAVSVPLKPTYLTKYQTIIEVDYRPGIVRAVEKVVGKPIGVGVGQPPDSIDDECYFDVWYYCFWWDLEQVLYETPGYDDPLPLQVTMVNDVDSANHIDELDHIVKIDLVKNQGSEVAFTIGLTVPFDRRGSGAGGVYVPGPGFSIGLGVFDPPRVELLDLYCKFDNVYNDVVDNSLCKVDGVYQPGLGGSFEWMGYVASGILGKIYVVEYEYKQLSCIEVVCFEDSLGPSYTVWVIPKTMGGDKLAPWVMVDDTALKKDTLLDHIAANINNNYTKTLILGDIAPIFVSSSHVFAVFNVTTKFGIAIPAGIIAALLLGPQAAPIAQILNAVSIGVAYNTYSISHYNLYMFQEIEYDAPRSVDVNVYRADVNYYINEFSGYYDVVLISVDPD